jgi:hypothetical protein
VSNKYATLNPTPVLATPASKKANARLQCARAPAAALLFVEQDVTPQAVVGAVGGSTCGPGGFGVMQWWQAALIAHPPGCIRRARQGVHARPQKKTLHRLFVSLAPSLCLVPLCIEPPSHPSLRTLNRICSCVLHVRSNTADTGPR